MSVIPTMVDVISIVRIPLEGIIVTVMMAITWVDWLAMVITCNYTTHCYIYYIYISASNYTDLFALITVNMEYKYTLED